MRDDVFSVFVAEDEQPARDLMLDYILGREELKLEGWSKDGEDAYGKLSEKKYDLMFLDINMPKMSGIELLEKLENPPFVIFTTAYDEYAIKAFEFGAIDYLLKPFTQERFNNAVDKALSVIRNKGPYPDVKKNLGLSFREYENYYLIGYNDIIYISSQGRHSFIHTRTKVYEAATSLKEIIPKLPEDLFVRIHKQCVVNLNFISHVQYLIAGQYAAFLKDIEKTTLTIGRSYAPALKGKFTF